MIAGISRASFTKCAARSRLGHAGSIAELHRSVDGLANSFALLRRALSAGGSRKVFFQHFRSLSDQLRSGVCEVHRIFTQRAQRSTTRIRSDHDQDDEHGGLKKNLRGPL
jgi:hypothetical protein